MKKTLQALALAAIIGVIALFSAIPAQAQDRHVVVYNYSSQVMSYFYASNIERTDWEEDILGSSRVLGVGRSIRINIDDRSGHCMFDLKAVFANRMEVIRRRVNVCRTSAWKIFDESNHLE